MHACVASCVCEVRRCGGMTELEEWKVGDGIPTIGKASERHRQKLVALKKSINATSKPYQERGYEPFLQRFEGFSTDFRACLKEFTLIRDQTKTINMRSPVVKCSVALAEWNGAMKCLEERMRTRSHPFEADLPPKTIEMGMKHKAFGSNGWVEHRKSRIVEIQRRVTANTTFAVTPQYDRSPGAVWCTWRVTAEAWPPCGPTFWSTRCRRWACALASRRSRGSRCLWSRRRCPHPGPGWSRPGR